MHRLIISWLGIVAAIFLVGQSFAQLSLTGAGKTTVGGGGGGCSDSATFLARGSFDGTHTTAYQNLICGLNIDGIGIFTNAWDAFGIIGTQDTTVAALNLTSTSFSLTIGGVPAFVADRGYTGVDASGTVFLNTNYNPSTNGVNFVQNSAHISVWSNTNLQAGTAVSGVCIGVANAGGTTSSVIIPQYTNGHTLANVNNGSVNLDVAASSTIGHFLANRSGASAQQLYYNGSSVNTQSNASAAPVSASVTILAWNFGGVVSWGCGNQVSAYSIGRSLNSTEVGNFYTRMRTFGTALGWT